MNLIMGLTCQVYKVEAGCPDAGHPILYALALHHTSEDAVGSAGVSIGFGGCNMPVLSAFSQQLQHSLCCK